MTTCPKCGYTRQGTDTQPDYECPQCGVIYARYEEAQKRKQEQATLKEQSEASARARNALLKKASPWIIGPLLAYVLLRWGGAIGLGALFLSPLAFYLYRHRNDASPSPTAACPTCGGLVAAGVKSCPHCGHKKPYPKPASKQAVVLAFLFVGFMIFVLANQQHDAGMGEDGVAANIYCENMVKPTLKAPSTAKFAGYSNSTVTSMGPRTFHVSSYVDAQNGFGAMLRNRYTCVVDFAAGTATIQSMN